MLFSYTIALLCFMPSMAVAMPVLNIDWAVQLFDFRNVVAFVLSLTTGLLDFTLAKRIPFISGTSPAVMLIENATAFKEPSRLSHFSDCFSDSPNALAGSLALHVAGFPFNISALIISGFNADLKTDPYQYVSDTGARICGFITLSILFWLAKRRTKITSLCRKALRATIKIRNESATLQILPSRSMVSDWTFEEKVLGAHSTLLNEDMERALMAIYQTQGESEKAKLICSYMPKVQAVSLILIEYWLPYPLTRGMAPIIKNSRDYPLHLALDADSDSEQGRSVTSVETRKSSIGLHHLKAFTGATPDQDTFTAMKSTIQIYPDSMKDKFHAILMAFEFDTSDFSSVSVPERAKFIHESMHHVDAFKRDVTQSRKCISRLRRSMDIVISVETLYTASEDTEGRLLRTRMQNSYNYLQQKHRFLLPQVS